MLFWIFLVLAIAALATVGAIVVRHWKEIRLLDPDSIKEERVRQTREHIIQQRFSRMTSGVAAPLGAMVKRGLLEGKKAFHAAYIRLVKLERFYTRAKSPFAAIAPSVKDRLKILLDEAKSLARDLKWADAERRFLEVLAMDDRNVDAYKGLGTIYLKQKLLPQARETFEFLVKMNKQDASSYASIAEVAEAEGRMDEAERMYRKAVDLQPKQPHYAVALARMYVEKGAAEDAWPLIVAAVNAEPKSPKYLEMKMEIALETRRQAEARRAYDRLRLVIDDRKKLQVLREKLGE